MITYDKSPFGINLLFRINGSAVCRATIPGLLSVICFVLIREVLPAHKNSSEDQEVRHPYALGILVSSITFLLVFRVQIAYARYWEAASAIHQMMSKWMDAAIHTAVFHMQCDHYDSIKPPSFYDHPDLNASFYTRDRETHTDEDESERIVNRSFEKSIERVTSTRFPRTKSQRFLNIPALSLHPNQLEGSARLDGNWGNLFPDGKTTYYDRVPTEDTDIESFGSFKGGRTPPLFLQELAHLASLLNGVALSTLRNDIEGSQSPLDIYKVGSPWPEVDPNKIEIPEIEDHGYTFKDFLYTIGMGRSPAERTKYNASRPIPVLGGVSEAEIRFLQIARGPYAKTQLTWAWLSEFITREHLAGSLGKVGPPIVSRIIQFLGDGMIHYNHARKIMFIPFPFPHSQLSAVYVLLTIPSVALLMDQYTDELWIGSLLAFFTVTCLAGIHEVARELENPFRNTPNELPLVTIQAQFNEALITMYSGYHPDAFWRAPSPSPMNGYQKSNGSPSKVQSPLESNNTQHLLEKLKEQEKEIERLRASSRTDTDDSSDDLEKGMTSNRQ